MEKGLEHIRDPYQIKEITYTHAFKCIYNLSRPLFQTSVRTILFFISIFMIPVLLYIPFPQGFSYNEVMNKNKLIFSVMNISGIVS